MQSRHRQPSQTTIRSEVQYYPHYATQRLTEKLNRAMSVLSSELCSHPSSYLLHIPSPKRAGSLNMCSSVIPPPWLRRTFTLATSQIHTQTIDKLMRLSSTSPTIYSHPNRRRRRRPIHQTLHHRLCRLATRLPCLSWLRNFVYRTRVYFETNG